MKKQTRIVAIDPGVVSGWAVMSGNVTRDAIPKLEEYGEALSPIDCALTLVKAVRILGAKTLVLEKFVPTRAPMSVGAIQTCETIGVLKWLAARMRISVALQAPAARTAFRKKVPDIYCIDTSSGHIFDAIAHGWRYYAGLRIVAKKGRR